MYSLIPQILVSGIAIGMIYAIIAFGYQLTFATSGTMNFGQGEALALGALVAFSLVGVVGYWVAIPIVLLFGAFQGIVVEWVAVRPALRTKSEFGWIMSTIALGIIFRNVAENVWGKEEMKFPSPLPEMAITFAGARVLPMELLVAAGAFALMLSVEFFNRKTMFGKAVVATASDREAAELMGINTSRVITFSFALSSLAAALAGMLIAPLTLAGARMGATLGLKAFAVAIIGGLTSGGGAIVGGMVLGIAETATGFYVSTGYKDVPGMVLLLIVLAVKPSGLFGKAAIKKV
ncbi:branched-chain amino acid ABC transporter permease [Paraburkholderia sp. 22B1P]|uniref:branched-chain amino acid ABC transporter permease n=1 Tax=Paraburkholderia sp. 22B1P TaxID=3080498 RepID=UPI00308990F5|nr:branched-chain amino acid ABC transporter permease [Paraburkholderia sp. 22B1P]